MFRTKAITVLVIVMLMSVTYIFAIDEYDTKPQQLKWLQEKVSEESIQYNEVGIELKGIIYNEVLDKQDIHNKLDEMNKALAHESICSKLCQMTHDSNGKKQLQEGEKGIAGSVQVRDENWQYDFHLKNQKDVHYNSYYDLKITGNGVIEHLEGLRSRGRDLLETFKVHSKESIYFKGIIKEKLSKEEREQLVKALLLNLEAQATNYYEDDLSKTTCAYYGYTHHIKDYIKERDGQKTNVQISFKYNEQERCTEVIVAFPFYNEPF